MANTEFDKLLLQNLEGINKKLDMMNEKFEKLPCGERLVRIDRLEQKEQERKENKALIWSAFFAAIGAFGISAWHWLKGQ